MEKFNQPEYTCANLTLQIEFAIEQLTEIVFHSTSDAFEETFISQMHHFTQVKSIDFTRHCNILFEKKFTNWISSLPSLHLTRSFLGSS